MKEIGLIIPSKKRAKAVKILSNLKINNYEIIKTTDGYKIEFIVSLGRTDAVIETLKKELSIGKSLADGMIVVSDKEIVAPFIQEKEVTKDPEHDLMERARRAASLDKNHVLFLALSTIIAVIGLQTNYSLVILGALLIAPVMDPVLGNAFGIVKKNASIIKNASKTLTVSLYLILIISFIVPIFTLTTSVSNEMMMRTHFGLKDIILAIVIGAIAALAFASDKSTTLIGVAAAISLMPPLATAGIFLLLGLYSYSISALILFTINLFGMYLGSIITFIAIEYKAWMPKKKTTPAKSSS